jgi:outer membrane protein OmpA-like peptidoglycan-associated protein
VWAGLAGASVAANADRPDIAPPAPPPGLDLSRAPEIPLVDGLVVVTAVADERGDYESVKRVSRGAERLLVSYSATVAVAGVPTEVRGVRVVLDKDVRSARSYRIAFRASPAGHPPAAPELARGSTALGLSTEVFEELRAEGRSECSLASIEEAGSLIGALGLPSPEYEGFLERIGTGAVAVPVVLDGERHWLPAIHAKGRFEGLAGEVDAEFWILDDPRNPLALRFAIGDRVLKVMRIDRPPGAAATRVEQALADQGQAELPGVYFEFASARLRPESEAAIAEVADVLRRHPSWRVRIEGHTDDVGGVEPNLALSRQRAEAVRAAILARLGAGGERLETAGFGAGQPRESNRTPEGRARNRRVEIRSLR